MFTVKTQRDAAKMMTEINYNFINGTLLQLLRDKGDDEHPLYIEDDEYNGFFYDTIYQPRNKYTREFLKNNAQLIYDKCDILVLENNLLGVFLAIKLRSGSYDFYNTHWKSLYKLIGYQWHKKENK